VRRGPNGYQLRVDADGVDLLQFRRLVAEARSPARPDLQRVRLLADALGLWRGVPLAGLRGQWAARQRDTWGLERAQAVLEWGQATLRLGDYARVIPVVRELTEQYPLDEPLAVVLGWALAAEGRRGEAAEHCKTVSERVRRETGLEPAAELRQLQQAVLADQPLPDLPPPPAPLTTPLAVPAQLPGDVPGFAGRVEHLTRLDALLAGAATEAPTAVVITAVSGTAGVGKTALAVHWAHRAASRFPDGQLYANLRGFGPGGQVVDPAAAVRGFLDAFGVPAEQVPADLDAQGALYRSLLAGKRMLVILDNARDAEHVRPLLPGTPTAFAIVTSRNSLTGLVAADGAHPLALDLLSTAEARQLLARRLPERVAAEPDAVEAIITACARLPLALSIAAARAAQSSFPLASLAAELADAADRLGALDAGDPATQVRAVFSWSYQALTPPAARLFRLLGLHPGPDVSAAAAASLAGLPLPAAGRLLAELTRASLITQHAPGRYSFHDLLAAYAADVAHDTESEGGRGAATTRLLDHYVHTAHSAARLLDPFQDPILLPLTGPAPATTPEQPAGAEEAAAWLQAERPVLLATIRLAAGAGSVTHAWQLAWALHTFLQRRGRWHDWAGAWQTVVADTDQLANPAAAGYAHRARAVAGTWLGRYSEARTHLRRALQLYAEAGDPAGQAYTHLALAGHWERQNQPEQSLDHAQQALLLYRAAGHPRGQANALNAVGWFCVKIGDYAQALDSCGQALALHQQAGDRSGEASTWDSLGYAHHHLGHAAEAIDCYQHALDIYRDLGDQYWQADTFSHLGDTHAAAGDDTAARAAWKNALEILTDLDHPDAAAVRRKLIRAVDAPRPASARPGATASSRARG
jgi:tetratricopeptide (TPR) repeat protein